MLLGNMNQPGYVAGPVTSVKQAMYSDERNQMIFVEYDALAKNPKSTMEKIYEFLGEPLFDHNFDDVEVSYDEFDEAAKIKDLHTTRKKVEYIKRQAIIPADLWARYESISFWKDPSSNRSELNWIKPQADKLQYFG